jgi:hypothetical protein
LRIHSSAVSCEPHSYLTICARCVLNDTHFCMYGDGTVISILKCCCVTFKEIGGRVTRHVEFCSPELKYFVFLFRPQILISLLALRRLTSYIYIYITYRTANLQTLHFIYLSTNIRTEYFKHAAHSPFFCLQNCYQRLSTGVM